jgi:uncharacterized membrane protein
MAEWTQAQSGRRLRERALPLNVVLIATAVLIGWALATPPGGLAKADAIGYAICHRIPSHSLIIGGRQLPLCARCSGIYLSALLGLITLAAAGRSRASRLPPLPVLLILIGGSILMGIDGVNSYLTLFPGLPHLYEPQNGLRLITGALHGLTLAAVLLPLFNSVAWQRPDDAPSLRNVRELLALILLAGLVVALALTEAPALLYPLALLSALGVVVMLSLVNALIALTLSRRANTATGWRHAWPFVLAGVALTFVEIGLIDVARFTLTGSWEGFVL